MTGLASVGVSHVCSSLTVPLNYKSFAIITLSSIVESHVSRLTSIASVFRYNDINRFSTLVAPNILISYSHI